MRAVIILGLAKICMAIFAPNERLPSAATLAHRYATFLCSWDVEIDDSLVGQLTICESGVGSNKAGES